MGQKFSTEAYSTLIACLGSKRITLEDLSAEYQSYYKSLRLARVDKRAPRGELSGELLRSETGSYEYWQDIPLGGVGDNPAVGQVSRFNHSQSPLIQHGTLSRSIKPEIPQAGSTRLRRAATQPDFGESNAVFRGTAPGGDIRKENSRSMDNLEIKKSHSVGANLNESEGNVEYLVGR